ncbi:MAG: hypothetical protein HY048_04355 [Acidobacteria bacterium]|nr:hypothetical protein [Acidobacteriota bacterium]
MGQDIRTAADLTEFSDEDYALAERAGIRLILKEERIFRGRIVDFAKVRWDETLVSSTEGRIDKISLQLNTQNKILARSVFHSTRTYLAQQMGTHSEHRLLSKKYIWDRDGGNAIIYVAHSMGWYSLNLFFTASFINLSTT